MDQERESLWQGARGRLSSEIAKESRGIPCAVRNGYRELTRPVHRPMCCSESAHCSSARRMECEHAAAQRLKLYFCPIVLDKDTELTLYPKSFRFGQLLFGLPCIYQSFLLSLQVITYGAPFANSLNQCTYILGTTKDNIFKYF